MILLTDAQLEALALKWLEDAGLWEDNYRDYLIDGFKAGFKAGFKFAPMGIFEAENT